MDIVIHFLKKSLFSVTLVEQQTLHLQALAQLYLPTE